MSQETLVQKLQQAGYISDCGVVHAAYALSAFEQRRSREIREQKPLTSVVWVPVALASNAPMYTEWTREGTCEARDLSLPTNPVLLAGNRQELDGGVKTLMTLLGPDEARESLVVVPRHNIYPQQSPENTVLELYLLPERKIVQQG